MSCEGAARAAGCDAGAELEDAVGLVSYLSNRETGARGAAWIDGDEVVLDPGATRLLPLRLSPAEGAALAHVLDALNIDDGARRRIARALLPADWADGPELIGTTDPYGRWYQVLSEAIADGARLRIVYSNQTDAVAYARTVDPLAIEQAGSAIYLIGWDVENGVAKRYLLDRISSVEVTEDSVERHPLEAGSIGFNLSSAPEATILCAERGDIPSGAYDIRPADGGFLADVRVASEPWLFDAVLGAAGAIRIVEPADLRERFVGYARSVIGG